MRMRLASFLTLSLFASSGALAMNVVGEAYSIDSNELRYREIHQCSVSGDRCTVEYQDPRGTVFARKTVLPAVSAFAVPGDAGYAPGRDDQGGG